MNRGSHLFTIVLGTALIACRWMHQLGGLSKDNYLDPDVFAAKTNAVLEAR